MKQRHKKQFWTPDEDAALAALFPDNKTELVATLLGRRYSQVANHAHYMKLNKSPEYMELHNAQSKKVVLEAGMNHRFKKGQAPVNKGKKLQEFMTVEGIKNSTATRFRKGNAPHNTRKDGDISIRQDKTGRSYQYIRVALAKWVLLHAHVWEQANGKVPEGSIIVFKDGNTMNTELSNLECITKAENMARNTIHRYPEEIVSTVRTIGVLNRKINSISKRL